VAIDVKSSPTVDAAAGCAGTCRICFTCGVGAHEVEINKIRIEDIRKII